MSLKKRDIVVLNRLRIGHTHYTHSHLIKQEPPRTCLTCGFVAKHPGGHPSGS